METMIAMCGLNCTECGAYLAKKNNDHAKRIETAKEWSEQFQVEIKPSDINCDGCLSVSDIRFHHCSLCEYRACGLEKRLNSCSQCDEYPCENIALFHKNVPEAKENSDKLRHA